MWVNLKRKVFSLVDVCTVEGTPLFYVWLNLKVTTFNSILIILIFLTSQQKHTHREQKKPRIVQLTPGTAPNINWSSAGCFIRGAQREYYSSKPLKHSIVKRILVFKRYIKWAYFYPLKILHLFGFPSWKSSDPKTIVIKTYLFENFKKSPENSRWPF